MSITKEKVRVAVWMNDHDIMGKAIRFLTHGTGTHAAFVRSNGRIVENFYPHVRERNWKPHETNQVEIYEIEGLTRSESNKLEEWLDKQLANPPSYSIRDLFRYAINWPPIRGNRCFCSMFVLRGIRLCVAPERQPLVRLAYEDYASPRDLRLSPRLKIQKQQAHTYK